MLVLERFTAPCVAAITVVALELIAVELVDRRGIGATALMEPVTCVPKLYQR